MTLSMYLLVRIEDSI
ncbi:hypothetical protein [Romboutsia timonensis]|nr:hypothetical protein [uncultured Romboutsia sp.]